VPVLSIHRIYRQMPADAIVFPRGQCRAWRTGLLSATKDLVAKHPFRFRKMIDIAEDMVHRNDLQVQGKHDHDIRNAIQDCLNLPLVLGQFQIGYFDFGNLLLEFPIETQFGMFDANEVIQSGLRFHHHASSQICSKSSQVADRGLVRRHASLAAIRQSLGNSDASWTISFR